MNCRFFMLGTLGMFFSEVLVWNAGLFSKAVQDNPVKGVLLSCGTNLLYIFLFYIFSGIIEKYSVRRFLPLVLLGSVYGLLLEGVFANKVFEPSFGFSLAGLFPASLLFPALSWHPVIDFAFVFFLAGALSENKISFCSSSLSRREILNLVFFSVFWTVFRFSKFHEGLFPNGMPESVHWFFVCYPLAVFGFFLFYGSFQQKNLGKGDFYKTRGYALARIVLVSCIVLKGILFPAKLQYLLFLAAAGFYYALFLLVQSRCGSGSTSITAGFFSYSAAPDFLKYLKICAVILASHALCDFLIRFFHLVPLCRIFIVLFIISSFCFGAGIAVCGIKSAIKWK